MIIRYIYAVICVPDEKLKTDPRQTFKSAVNAISANTHFGSHAKIELEKSKRHKNMHIHHSSNESEKAKHTHTTRRR